jgi:signal transduction histidine kinase
MEFTALVASAISNTASREQLARLADEHAALRRVATLVAQGIPPPEVFAAVAREVGLLLGVEWVHMARYEPDGTSIGVAGWSPAGDQIPVGTRVELAGDSVGGRVLQTGRPARMEDYETASGAAAAMGRARGLRSSVGAPIVVDQRLWGMMMAASKGDRRLPDDTELRIAAFTELVATAISNTEARTELRQLAEEQAALRRVATLVAQAVPPDEVFAAVAEEVARVLPVEHAAMARYEPDGTMTVVAASAGVRDRFPVGGRWTLGGNTVSSVVMETGRAARIDSYAAAPGALAAAIRERGLHSGVGAPIVVDGRLWGVMTASSSDQPLPADTEARVELFTELVATAIANAHARAALAASRARVVTAADETRRRIERDLHDGTQQRLVSLLLELRMMEATMPSDVDELREQLARTAQGLGGMLEELREIAHGIHPAILTQGGLSRALSALARRSPVRVELDLRAEGRLPEPVEVAAYYVVSESLTNVAKHAHASVVNVELDTQDSILRLAIRDDGVGGADRARGSGLVGLSDRVEALGGTLEVSSPPGGGTTVVIEVPVEGGRIADPQLKP